MKAQFKYALLRELPLRATALAALILLNLTFGILGYFGVLGNAALITGVSLVSVALCGIFAVNIIADARIMKSIFDAPEGYLSALTPVKSWKILLANTVVIVIEDIISLFIGIFGIVWQAMVLGGAIGLGAGGAIGLGVSQSLSHHSRYLPDIIFLSLMLLLGYTYIILLLMFGSAFKNSVLFGVPARSWLALLSVAAVAWVFNLLNFVLAPFGEVYNWGIFYSIGLTYSFNAGTTVWLLLILARIAALFVASSILLERKNNL